MTEKDPTQEEVRDKIRAGLKALEEAAIAKSEELMHRPQIVTAGPKQDNYDDNSPCFMPPVRPRRVDTDAIRRLAESDRKGLVEVLASGIEALEQEKENNYAVINSITSRLPMLDSFTLMSLAKFFESAGKQTSEVTRILKMLSDLALQWEVIDHNKAMGGEGASYEELSTQTHDDKPEGFEFDKS